MKFGRATGESSSNSGSSAFSGTKTVPAALVHEVEAVVEELAEQREPRVVRRRQADVGRDVRDEERARRRRSRRASPAAATAAGLAAVWSTTRLLMIARLAVEHGAAVACSS